MITILIVSMNCDTLKNLIYKSYFQLVYGYYLKMIWCLLKGQKYFKLAISFYLLIIYLDRCFFQLRGVKGKQIPYMVICKWQ